MNRGLQLVLADYSKQQFCVLKAHIVTHFQNIKPRYLQTLFVVLKLVNKTRYTHIYLTPYRAITVASHYTQPKHVFYIENDVKINENVKNASIEIYLRI